jgi:hypothetical protein
LTASFSRKELGWAIFSHHLGACGKFEDDQAVFGANLEFGVGGLDVFDAGERDLQASVTAENDFRGFEQGFTREGSSRVAESARKFAAHGRENLSRLRVLRVKCFKF